MPPVKLLDNEYVTLLFHPEKKIIHHEFKKFIFGDSFRQVLLTGLDAMKKNGATKWLSDDRANSALPREDGEWALSVWTPQVVAAGWKYWAIVLPEKAIGQMSMKKFMEENSKRGVMTRGFPTSQAALKWLESV
jgi:hypothetical protein